MSFSDIILRIGATADGAKATLDRVVHDVERMKVAVQGSFVIEVGEVIWRGAEALGEFVHRGAEAAEQMGKMAQVAGITVEEMSGLAYAAKLSDVSTDQLSKGILKLSDALSKAAAGGKGDLAIFEAMFGKGVDLQAMLGDTHGALLAVADKIASYSDGAQKAALVSALFGERLAREMLPFLNKGADGIREAEDELARFGRTLTGEVSEGSDRFNEALKRLSGGAELLGAMIASDVEPSLTSLVQIFSEGGESARLMQDASKELAEGMRILATTGLGVYAAFKMAGLALAEWSALSQTLNEGSLGKRLLFPLPSFISDLTSKRDALKAIIDQSDKDFDQFGEHVRQIFDAIQNTTVNQDAQGWAPEGSPQSHQEARPAAPGVGSAATNAAEKALEDVQRALRDYQKAVDTFGLSTSAKRRWDVEFGELAVSMHAAGAAGEALKPTIVGLVDQLDALERADKASKAMADLQGEVGKLNVELAKGSAESGSEYEKMLERLSSGDLAKSFRELAQSDPMASARLQDDLLQRATGLDAQKRAAAATKVAMEEFNKTVEESVRLTEEAETPTEHYAEQLRHLQEMLSKGAITPETAARLLKKYQEELDKATGKVDQLAEAWKRFGEGFQSVLEQQMVDGFKGGLQGMLDAFGDMIRRMLAQAAAAQLAQSLLGGFASLGHAALGWFNTTGEGASELSGVYGPGAGGAQLPRPRAAGGDVSAGSLYLVGEKGPELFSPSVSGMIVSNDALSRAASAQKGEVTHRLVFDDRYRHMTIQEWFESYLSAEAAAR